MSFDGGRRGWPPPGAFGQPYIGLRAPDVAAPGMPARGPAPMPTPGMPSPERPWAPDQWRALARSSRLGARVHLVAGLSVQEARLVDISLDAPESIVFYAQADIGQPITNAQPIPVYLRLLWGSGGALIHQQYKWPVRGIGIQVQAATLQADVVVGSQAFPSSAAAGGIIPAPGFDVVASASPGRLREYRVPEPSYDIAAAAVGGALRPIPEFAQFVDVRQSSAGEPTANDVLAVRWVDQSGGQVGQLVAIGDYGDALTVIHETTDPLPIPQEAVLYQVVVLSGAGATVDNSIAISWRVYT